MINNQKTTMDHKRHRILDLCNEKRSLKAAKNKNNM